MFSHALLTTALSEPYPWEGAEIRSGFGNLAATKRVVRCARRSVLFVVVLFSCLDFPFPPAT